MVGGTLTLDLRAFVQRHSKLRGDALVAYTYKRFPFMAIHSEIADRVLEGDDGALARIEAARAQRGDVAVQTIGYEGHSLESYLNTLLHGGVNLLCDVRKNPLSRKYGFSKNALARGCQGVGIRYEHLPELGIDSSQRRGLDTQADYDALFAEYRTSSLPRQGGALERIKGWIGEGARVALTCYEHSPEQCHRHCVAAGLAERFGEHFQPQHL